MQFRAWDKSKKEMLHLVGGNMFAIYSNGIWVLGFDNMYGEALDAASSEDRDILMQGIDLDGLIVYEGDIIRESHHLLNSTREYDITTGIIELVKGCLILNLGKRGKYTLYERHPYSDTLQSRDWSVVGNIYETPELL